MPAVVEDATGSMVAELPDLSAPVIEPVPNSEPRFRLIPPDADKVPLSVVILPDWVKTPRLPIENVLPLLMVKVPALVKFPAVVNERFPAKAKLPLLVAKFARALALDWLTIWEVVPVNVMLAALVTTLALLNCSVPVMP